MNIAKILAIASLLVGGITRADEVNRDSQESKDRPHMIVSGIVESIEEVRKEEDGVILMKAKLKIFIIHRLKNLTIESNDKPFSFFYRTGLAQRPRLPELKKLGEYRMYLRQMKVNEEQEMYLEFEDDVSSIEKSDK